MDAFNKFERSPKWVEQMNEMAHGLLKALHEGDNEREMESAAKFFDHDVVLDPDAIFIIEIFAKLDTKKSGVLTVEDIQHNFLTFAKNLPSGNADKISAKLATLMITKEFDLSDFSVLI